LTLASGVKLGVYEVVSLVGVGGMGEVYRARDTRLQRDVALKVLPQDVAADPDRLARFMREAQLLAALNHPHIGGIYGVEQGGDSLALVLEFVDGQTLADRVARGPIPLDEALPLAAQIIDALEAAHAQGIVHRDLKPANIKVRPDGTVKVLDFGLAKAFASDTPEPSYSHSPTLTLAATRAGVLLGTAAYMSPEQARGWTVDKRTDVWAFGCVLFELLAGRRTFDGENLTDVVAAVVRGEPEWSRLPPDTPTSIRRLLRRCLEKDRKRRLADIADARLELDDAATDQPVSAVTDARLLSRRQQWAMVAIVAASLLSGAAMLTRPWRARTPDVQVLRFDIAPPAGGNIEFGQPLSPDGRTVAFVSTVEGKSTVWMRPLDSGTAYEVPGTDGASRVFWSPDSRYIGFFVDGNLKKLAIAGGRPELVASGPFRDGAWSHAGVILLGGQRGRPLVRVSASNGAVSDETVLDASRGEVSHDYPEFLPDGKHYIYLARTTGNFREWTSYIGTLGSEERRPLPGIRTGVKYSPSGHLLFLRGDALMAQRFDPDRLALSDEATRVAESVLGGRINSFSTSANGSLAYVSGFSQDSTLGWFSRDGRKLGTVGRPAVFRAPTLSSDARFVAFDRGTPSDVWGLDVDRGSTYRMTTDAADERWAVWSPNGSAVAFFSNRAGSPGIYERKLDSAGQERRLLAIDANVTLSDWSRDGQYLAYLVDETDVWVLPLAGTHDPLRITNSPLVRETDATFSPDGRWIAYSANESSGISRSEESDVIVQSFPRADIKRQVSTGGGFVPHWSVDGKELIYLAPDGRLMAVSIALREAGIDVGSPTPLFQSGLFRPSTASYSVSRDGRFLMQLPVAGPAVTVIINWAEALNDHAKKR